MFHNIAKTNQTWLVIERKYYVTLYVNVLVDCDNCGCVGILGRGGYSGIDCKSVLRAIPDYFRDLADLRSAQS